MKAECPFCFLDLQLYPPLEGTLCPGCKRSVENAKLKPSEPEWASSLGDWVSSFFKNLQDIIFKPKIFFSSHANLFAQEDGLAGALAFAIVVQWLASFFNFLWRAFGGIFFRGRFEDFLEVSSVVFNFADPTQGVALREVLHFLFGAGSVLLSPFTSLFTLAVGTLLIHIAVRFLAVEQLDRPHRYSTTLKILAYCSAPWILCIIPGVGMLAAYILVFLCGVIGLREVYRMNTTRATIAVLFPEILFLCFLLFIFFMFLYLGFLVFRILL